jgi:hypothetical protein
MADDADTVEYEIEGRHSLQQIQDLIDGQEAGGCEFTDSRIGIIDNKVTNIATFKKLTPGTLPNAIALGKRTAAPPEDAEKFWTGVMIVSGQNQIVHAYRANA